MAVYVGLDIGGTKLMVVAADAGGTMLGRTRRETPPGPDDGLEVLHAMISRVCGSNEIAGMGAAVGGPLDREQGTVSPLHQPGWLNVPLGQIMEERWHCPCHVDVDTNAAALGEYAALERKPGRFLYVTLSTGMGGGFLVDGEVYRGAGGAHPEVAHQSINYHCAHPERISCECGAADCVEALVSGNGIRRVYGKPAEELSEPEWSEVAHNLGQGLRNAAALLVPDLIVLGGGVALGGGDRLMAQARDVMAAGLKIVPMPQVCLSCLGQDTALAGALVLARMNPR